MRNRKRLVLGLLLLPITSFALEPGSVTFVNSTKLNPEINISTSSTVVFRNISVDSSNANARAYGFYSPSNATSVGDLYLYACPGDSSTYNIDSSCFLVHQIVKANTNWNGLLVIPSGYSLYGGYLDGVFNGEVTVFTLYSPYSFSCGSSSNDSECQEQLAQLSGDYVDLSEQYASLLLYNTSIEQQLQQCLMSGGNSILSGMCSSLDLFWFNNDQMYSSPITNNLVLPDGYRALVDSGVVSIAPIQTIEYANSMDDEEFEKVVEGFGTVFLYFFGISLLLVFMYYIRKYFIGLKN